jgi:hypothetical protein
MKKGFIVLTIVLSVMVLSLVAFYSVPFIKSDNLISSANRQTLSEIEEIFNPENKESFISKENYLKLKITDDLKEDEYIDFKIKQKVKFENLTSLKITCQTKATVYNCDYVAQSTSGATHVLTFSFKSGKWQVINVN